MNLKIIEAKHEQEKSYLTQTIVAKIKTNKQIEQTETNGHDRAKNPPPPSCQGHQSKTNKIPCRWSS